MLTELLRGKPTGNEGVGSAGPAAAQLAAGSGGLRFLAWASLISTFALIVLGGVVRVTGSGLGCGGDWPLCDGRLLPAMTAADIIEYSHRLMASALVGPLIVATCAWAWFRFRQARAVVIPASVAVLLVLAQGGLGGITVLTELPGHIVAAHLALAQALLGCLIMVLAAAYRNTYADLALNRPAAADRLGSSQPGPGKPDGMPRLVLITAFSTYLLLLSGAYVTATPGALAVCPQWPLCQGLNLPATNLEIIHMLHRVVAAVVGLLALYVFYRAWLQGVNTAFSSGRSAVIILSAMGAALLITQILVGAIAIWSGFPVFIRALHIALATAVWGVTAGLALAIRPRSLQPSAHPQ